MVQYGTILHPLDRLIDRLDRRLEPFLRHEIRPKRSGIRIFRRAASKNLWRIVSSVDLETE